MKNKTVYIIFFILLIIAVVIYFTQKNSTIKEELRDFAVKDTGSITKIFMVEKNNNKVTLYRKSNYWSVNDKYIARPDAIKTLLETIATVAVKEPVPKAALPNIIKQLATNSTKIEIYKGDELVKVYYVGFSTPNQMGTYMMLENSKVPFVTHKPGFFGYLSTRYFTSEELWRDNSIFLYEYSDIASVEVKFTDAPQNSYTIIQEGNNQFKMLDDNQKEISDFEKDVAKEFLARFKKVKCESFVANTSQQRIDSLLNSKSILRLTVTNRKGEANSVILYPRPNFTEYVDDEGNVLPHDPDAMYGVLNNSRQLIVCQYFVFGPLMMDRSYFLQKRPS